MDDFSLVRIELPNASLLLLNGYRIYTRDWEGEYCTGAEQLATSLVGAIHAKSRSVDLRNSQDFLNFLDENNLDLDEYTYTEIENIILDV